MENKFERLTLFEFQECFPNEKACLSLFSSEEIGKWFSRFQRGVTHFCKDNILYAIVYTLPPHNTPTSGMLFYHVKFLLLKVFILCTTRGKVFYLLS